MMVNFWVSAVVGFSWRLWPRATWIVVLGLTALNVVWMVTTSNASGAPVTFTTLFGGWPQIGEVAGGYVFGRWTASSYQRDMRKGTRK